MTAAQAGGMTATAAERDRIRVVLAADAHYVMPLATAICSAAINCNRRYELIFYVIQSGIAPGDRVRVEKSLRQNGSPRDRIQWLDAPLAQLAEFDLAHSWTTSLTFARLFIPELLPAEAERVLYLDADIVVDDDLGQLWELDFGDRFLFAVRDELATVSEPRGIRNYRELGIPADAHYFNAGVLLIDLRKWREHRIGGAVQDYLRTHRAIIQCADQEALNAVLWRHWAELDYRWNWQIPWKGYRRGKARPSWNPPAHPKSIIHFTCSEKPWRPGCDYAEKHYFFKYLDRTDWAGWRVGAFREATGFVARALQGGRDGLGRFRRRLLGTA